MYPITLKSKLLFILISLVIISCKRDYIQNSVSNEYWVGTDSNFYTQIEVPYTEDYIVYVQKDAHILYLYKQGKKIKEYKVNLRNELPARRLLNDGQTPEGIFEVYQMAVVTNPAWCRWIAFNTVELAKEIYINENSQGTRLIEEFESKYGQIMTDKDIRKFNRKNPDIELLRGFGIHGGGYYPGNDWTLGCPALNDDDVTELYDLLLTNPNGGIGTKVIIVD